MWKMPELRVGHELKWFSLWRDIMERMTVMDGVWGQSLSGTF